MLYTVKPLERIYAPPQIFDPARKERQAGKQKQEQEYASQDEYKEVILPNGRIMTRRDGENYVIEKVNSTDMKDYLNDKYSPGKNYME